MKSYRRYLLVLGMLMLTVSACSKKPESGENTEQTGAKRQFLSIGTAPPGGAFFVVGSAIAEVAGANIPGGKWQISAEATKGTQENLRRLDRGEIDFALANAAISYFAVRGQGKWEKAYPIKAIMTLAPNVAFFITPASSGIKTITDLKGKRVVVGPAGAGFEYFVEPILKAHGLNYNDIRALNDTQAGAVALLADGSADAAFLGGAVPTSSITQACAGQDIHFIPFTEQAMNALVEQYAFYDRMTIPAKTYRGQTEPFHGLNVGNMILVASDKTDEDTAYLLTKTLFENAAQVVERHPAGKAINPKNAVRATGTDFHPGAIRFFKEIGIWPTQDPAGL